MKQFIAWIEYIPGEQVHGQRFIESGSSGRNIQGFIHASVIQHEFKKKKNRVPMLALLLVNNYRKQEGMRLLL